jgi:diguanylate cyclase (GGDEF)-like protein/PAS domain S-box-containing protein
MMTIPNVPTYTSRWLNHGGQIAESIHSIDWEKSSLGPIDLWPNSLKNALCLCLSSPLPMSVIWGEHHIHFYNGAYAALFEPQQLAVLGEDFRFRWAAIWPSLNATLQKAASGISSQFDHDYRFIDSKISGNVISFTSSFSPIIDENNQISGIMQLITASNVQDIHILPPQPVLECTLSQDRNKPVVNLFEQMMATMPDILFVYDVEADNIVYCSTSVSDILGYTVDKFQPSRVLPPKFIHPHDFSSVLAWLREITSADGNSTHAITVRVRHKNRSYRCLQVRASAFMHNENNKPKQILGIARDITDQHNAEAALQLREERQRFSLDAGMIGAWDFDMETGRIWRTATHDRIFGYTSPLSEWTYELFLHHVIPEDRERISQQFTEALQSATDWSHECRIKRTDGEVRTITVHGRVKRSRRGKPLHVYGATYDVTEQARMKESLQQQTRILHLILDSMSEGVMVCDAQGELILTNQSAKQLLNMENTSVRNLHELDTAYGWYLPDGSTLYSNEESPLARSLCGEKISEFEGIVRSFDKEVDMAINSSAAPIRDEIGNIVGAVNVFRDVTASKRAMQDLYDAEQHFKLLVEGTTDYAIFMLDVNGYIVSWNPGAQRILGYERDEVLGKHVSLFSTQEDISRGEPQRKLQQTIEDGRAEEDSWRVRKDGRRFWSTGVLGALHDERGHVRGFVKIMRDNTARRLAEENTFFLANHDPLTGLANRARFMERLNEALLNADRDNTEVAVLLLDLDRFKMINDTMGHHAGDILLQRVAHRLTKCVRETDTVARLGGDEFVIILTHLKDLPSVEILAKKIVEEMARPYYINRQEVKSGTSLGVAMYRKDGNDVGDLLQKADLAMYRAKSSGRNQYRIFTQSMLTEIQTRKEQEDNLRLALERHEFELAFQPQINLDTLRLTGAEALLRSTNRILQHMPARQIIALAEETGLIIPLGEWILQAACRQLKKWQQMGLPPFKIAVNFSSIHLLAPGFINTIRRTLTSTKLDPRYLEVEITEGVLVAASEGNNEVITALKETGVSISVDDFGTGFSALSYLKSFPVDVLKLDESLVRHLPSDHEDVAIVSAIIKLALDLNIKVVAEGVETADQLAYLRSTRCATAQGFLFSPAVKAEKFESILRATKATSLVLH